MTFVERDRRVQELRAQHASFVSVSVIGIYLVRTIAFGLVISLFVEISEAEAVTELAASAVAAAGAAATETILCSFDTLSVDHLVDEAEVVRQDLVVYIVDNGDGDRLMRWE